MNLFNRDFWGNLKIIMSPLLRGFLIGDFGGYAATLTKNLTPTLTIKVIKSIMTSDFIDKIRGHP